MTKKRGGNRPGAGRPSATDGTARKRSIYCTDDEHKAIKEVIEKLRTKKEASPKGGCEF